MIRKLTDDENSLLSREERLDIMREEHALAEGVSIENVSAVEFTKDQLRKLFLVRRFTADISEELKLSGLSETVCLAAFGIAWASVTNPPGLPSEISREEWRAITREAWNIASALSKAFATS